jgi:hypothetical protein
MVQGSITLIYRSSNVNLTFKDKVWAGLTFLLTSSYRKTPNKRLMLATFQHLSKYFCDNAEIHLAFNLQQEELPLY